MSGRFLEALRVASVITITSACAGHGATSSPTCAEGDELECEGSASAQNLENPAQCEAVTFIQASGTANGLLACFAASYPADIVVASPEPCEGRGLGEPLQGPDRCSSSTDCPGDSECSPSGLCHNRPECEDDSGCGPVSRALVQGSSLNANQVSSDSINACRWSAALQRTVQGIHAARVRAIYAAPLTATIAILTRTNVFATQTARRLDRSVRTTVACGAGVA